MSSTDGIMNDISNDGNSDTTPKRIERSVRRGEQYDKNNHDSSDADDEVENEYNGLVTDDGDQQQQQLQGLTGRSTLESRFYTATAFDLLQRLKSRIPIVTFSKSLDQLLGGGILPFSGIYELCGCPGSGKTQLCVQLAVNVQIPKQFGGNQKKAIYIDTEGSFSALRCSLMAHALVQHLNLAKPLSDSDGSVQQPTLTVESLMDNIFVFRVFDEFELLGVILHLELGFMSQHENVGLIIIDSISFPFRCSSITKNLSRRLNLLLVISTILNRLSTHKDIAIVITNQMTSRFIQQQPANDSASTHYNNQQQQQPYNNNNHPSVFPSQQSVIVPCLGDSWAHIPSHRLLIRRLATTQPITGEIQLKYEDNQNINHDGTNSSCRYYRSLRCCELLKSNGLLSSAEDQSKSLTAKFEIKREGIRDVLINNSNCYEQNL